MSSIIGVHTPEQLIPLGNIWNALDANVRVAPRINIGEEGAYAGALFSIEGIPRAQLISSINNKRGDIPPTALDFRTHNFNGVPFIEIHVQVPVGESVANTMRHLGLHRVATSFAVAGTTIFWKDASLFRNIEESNDNKLWLALCGDITRVLTEDYDGKRYNNMGVEMGFPDGSWGFTNWARDLMDRHDLGKGVDIPTVFYVAGIEFSDDKPRFFAIQHDSEPPFRMFRSESGPSLLVASSQEGVWELRKGLDDADKSPECITPMSVLRPEYSLRGRERM